jgi:hypothetical protein
MGTLVKTDVCCSTPALRESPTEEKRPCGHFDVVLSDAARLHP